MFTLYIICVKCSNIQSLHKTSKIKQICMFPQPILRKRTSEITSTVFFELRFSASSPFFSPNQVHKNYLGVHTCLQHKKIVSRYPNFIYTLPKPNLPENT